LEYFNGSVVVEGIDQARGFFRLDPSSPPLGLERLEATTHLWNIVSIDVDGDQATAETICVAHLFGVASDEEVLITRGLRYSDKLKRSEAGWLIRTRLHQPRWESRSVTIRQPDVREEASTE
jgi:hypothetical protein